MIVCTSHVWGGLESVVIEYLYTLKPIVFSGFANIIIPVASIVRFQAAKNKRSDTSFQLFFAV